MATTSKPILSAFPGSKYAAELRDGIARPAFSAELEADYVREHLLANRTLIRAACVLAALIAAGRGIEQLLIGSFQTAPVLGLGFVLAASLALAAIAWTPAFERIYLPFANAAVPLRNAVAAIFVAAAAARGEHETLMLLLPMVLGPFFFLGLRFRAAVLAVAVTLGSFLAASAVFALALPIVARAGVLLGLTTAACAIAARHLERWSRRSFLERELIAELAQHDALTGLKNRRVFDEELERRWAQAIEDRVDIAIVLADVDHFKAFNDLYGHQAGDHALGRVAQALQALVSRPLDVIARYGGEELAVILYDVDAREAEMVAQRMRRAVAALGIEHAESAAGDHVTVSIGVALIAPRPERRSRGALQLADQALYEAKVQGRDRVVLMDQAAHNLLETGVFARAKVIHG